MLSYQEQSHIIMEQQKPLKPASQDTGIPPEPAQTTNPAEEPEQVIRPEDEALVAERLRELGYIE